MGYFVGLIVVLVALWLGLSWDYSLKTVIASLGAVSVLLSAILAYRFDILDREGSPYGRLLNLMAYWVWLMMEIFKANWVVIKACLRSNLDINPALVKVKTGCESDLARTVFANSITLTPGTVTLDVFDNRLLVHCITREGAQAIEAGDANRRIAELTGK